MHYKEDKAVLIIPFKYNDRYIAVKNWYIAYQLVCISEVRGEVLDTMCDISSRIDDLSNNIACVIISLRSPIYPDVYSSLGRKEG